MFNKIKAAWTSAATGAILLLLTSTTAQAAEPLISAQEQADAKIVSRADAVGGTQGFAALAAHKPALQEVLAHAPARYPMIEIIGSTTVVRSDTPGEATARALLGGSLGTATRQIYVTANVYPRAAMLLGSLEIEAGHPERATAWLDRGLALQPGNGDLTSEKGVALVALGRCADALQLYDAWLAMPDGTPWAARARILRGKGFCHIEGNQLDAAETAYRAALALEPNHAVALREMSYIAQLRAGGPAGKPLGITTADKAATGDAEGLLPYTAK